MKSVKIGNDIIGDGHTIHVISEIGGNFTDFETAQKLIDLSIDVGANSVKLQTYRAETITSEKQFMICQMLEMQTSMNCLKNTRLILIFTKTFGNIVRKEI